MSVRQQSHPFERRESWYATEVPAIVAGLESSDTISLPTAERARQLLDQGAYQQALSLVLGEVF